MGSNDISEREPVVSQSPETTQDQPATAQSRSDAQSTQQDSPNPLNPGTTDDSQGQPDQPISQSLSTAAPATSPPSDELTKEAIPEPVDNAPNPPTEDPLSNAHTTLSHTESLEPKFSTAIGPSSDQPNLSTKESDETGPALAITLLLTTGARHPFKIDGKYLRKRAVNVADQDPFSMSVYTLKELIWREWRPEWESRPASPTSIRLISFGKLLDDKAPLSDSKLNHDAPNVLHMTVKPQEVVEDEDAKGAKGNYGREQEPTERSPRCRCVIL